MRAGRQAQRFAALAGGLAMLCFAGACTRTGTRASGRVPDPADSVTTSSGSRQAADEATGATSVLGEEELDRMRGSRIEQMIAGRFPGLEVIATPDGYTFRIRGAASLMGRDEPLCIIDGVPVRAGGISSALSMLMPRDIARIEVLRDAGATAAYGSRGANGVIIITTKR